MRKRKKKREYAFLRTLSLLVSYRTLAHAAAAERSFALIVPFRLHEGPRTGENFSGSKR